MTYNDVDTDPDRHDLANPCPICGEEMKHQFSMVNEGTIGESSNECPDGHYIYEFTYGYTYIRVCGVSWRYGYGETGQDIRDRGDAVALVIECNRFPSLAATLAMMSPEVLSRTI